MNHRTVIIFCTIVAVAACANIDGGSKTLKVGTYPLNTVITVQDDICIMLDGKTKKNGVIYYNTGWPAKSTICVSLKSDDPHRTAQHELCHACHLATGADVKVIDR